MDNVIINIPKKGDIVCIDTYNNVKFIDLESFNINTLESGWITVGVVGNCYGDEILIIHKTNASKKWSDIYSFRLSGYTLDGTERTGVFTIYTAASIISSICDNNL